MIGQAHGHREGVGLPDVQAAGKPQLDGPRAAVVLNPRQSAPLEGVVLQLAVAHQGQEQVLVEGVETFAEGHHGAVHQDGGRIIAKIQPTVGSRREKVDILCINNYKESVRYGR